MIATNGEIIGLILFIIGAFIAGYYCCYRDNILKERGAKMKGIFPQSFQRKYKKGQKVRPRKKYKSSSHFGGKGVFIMHSCGKYSVSLKDTNNRLHTYVPIKYIEAKK